MAKVFLGTIPPEHEIYPAVLGHTFMGISKDGKSENIEWFEIRPTRRINDSTVYVKMKKMSIETINDYLLRYDAEIIYKEINNKQYQNCN